MSNETKKCAKCARWTKPTKNSACYMSEEASENELSNVKFIKNDDGTFGCDDFALVIS